MKKCKYKYKKEQGIEYALQLMDSKKKKKYENHLKNCSTCQACQKEILVLNDITEYKKKIKTQLPLFDDIHLPVKVESDRRYNDFLSNVKYIWENKTWFRLAFSFSVLIFFILNISLLLVHHNKTENIAEKIKHDRNSKKNYKYTQIPLKKGNKRSIKAQEDKWCFDTKGPLRIQPVIRNSILYLGSDDKNVYAINSHTGKLIWRFHTEGCISSQPIIRDDFLYATSTDGYLYKLQLLNGQMIWKKKVGPLVLSRIYINHSNIYVANNNGDLLAINKQGDTLWEKKIDDNIYCPITGDQFNLYLGTSMGMVYAVSKKNGIVKWELDTESHFLSSGPVVINNQLIMGDTDGMVYSIDPNNKSINWKYKTGYQIITDPILKDKKIYIASDKIYCFNLKGKKLWEYMTDAPIDVNLSIDQYIMTAIDKNNNVYSLHINNGYCMNKTVHDNYILSVLRAKNRIFVGNQEGKICVLK